MKPIPSVNLPGVIPRRGPALSLLGVTLCCDRVKLSNDSFNAGLRKLRYRIRNTTLIRSSWEASGSSRYQDSIHQTEQLLLVFTSDDFGARSLLLTRKINRANRLRH